MTSSLTSPCVAGTTLGVDGICHQTVDFKMEERIKEVASLIWSFCKPLLDLHHAGPKPSAGDAIHILQDCLIEAERLSPGSVGAWRVESGRITTAQSRHSLYNKGQWLQSVGGTIIDLNRDDLEDGYRYTQSDDSPIAEYRREPGKIRTKTSPLLPIWRGEHPSPFGQTPNSINRESYTSFKREVARVLLGT
ncbi:hypothetical protein KUV57_11905 [Epibacterium sp. DP7N7-1]|nr:hypothetical protein [Epibacterium sp. DP7N7-1]